MRAKRFVAIAFLAQVLMVVAAPAVSAETTTNPTVCYDVAFKLNDIAVESADCVSTP